MRLLGLGNPGHDSAPGAAYALEFTVGSPRRQRFSVTAWRTATGTSGTAARLIRDEIAGESIATPAVVFDERASEVRMTLPLAALRRYADAPRGSAVTDVAVVTASYARLGVSGHADTVPPVSLGADAGRSFGTYRLDSPSCVKPGR